MIAAVHELAVPALMAWVWRGVVFVLAAALLGVMWTFIRDRSLPPSRRILMVALAIATARVVLVNAERFDDRVFWEGLPIETVWLGVAGVGLCRWYRESGQPRR